MTTIAHRHAGTRDHRRVRRARIAAASLVVATTGLLAVSGTVTQGSTESRRGEVGPVAATTLPAFAGMTPDAAIRWSIADRSSYAGMSPDAAERWRALDPENG